MSKEDYCREFTIKIKVTADMHYDFNDVKRQIDSYVNTGEGIFVKPEMELIGIQIEKDD